MAPELKPADPDRCDAHPNMLGWSSFSLGPMPAPKRCENKPRWIAREVEPGKDGQCGEMSLCLSCMTLMRDRAPEMFSRCRFTPIN